MSIEEIDIFIAPTGSKLRLIEAATKKYKYKLCDGCNHFCVHPELNSECPCETSYATGRTSCSACPVKACNGK